jgi:regulator of nonsense transcripts 1
VENWQPLISNRALLSWLVKVPDEAALVRSRRVTSEQIQRLEEVWRTRPELTLDSLNQSLGGADAAEDALVPVRLRYSDAFEYQEIHAPLIACEAEYDKQLKEGKRVEGVSVRWDTGLNGQRLAFFSFPRATEEFRIALGDELIVKHRHKAKLAVSGFIVKNPLRTVATEELCVEVKHHQHHQALEDGPHYVIEFVWKGTSYDRMHVALRQLAVDDTCMDLSIFKQIMGHDVGESAAGAPAKSLATLSVNAPGLPALNHSQAHAVRAVMARPLSLIQGPPGTGKTVTSAAIVYHLASLNEGPVLVTAPSNVAVDHLTEKIHKTGLRAVRIAAKWREDVDTSVSFLSLHEQVRNNETKTELQRLIRLRDTLGELSKGDQEKYLRLVRAAEFEILKVSPGPAFVPLTDSFVCRVPK